VYLEESSAGKTLTPANLINYRKQLLKKIYKIVDKKKRGKHYFNIFYKMYIYIVWMKLIILIQKMDCNLHILDSI
jgi:hypothetical protein